MVSASIVLILLPIMKQIDEDYQEEIDLLNEIDILHGIMERTLTKIESNGNKIVWFYCI